MRKRVRMRKNVPKPHARYAVGYGRPPTSSQFQPGQSGNPQGPPKGVHKASSMARDALERTINVFTRPGMVGPGIEIELGFESRQLS